MNMRLLGAPTIKDVVREMVDASNLSSHVVAVPNDSLFNTNCTELKLSCLFDANIRNVDEVMQHAVLKLPLKAKI